HPEVFEFFFAFIPDLAVIISPDGSFTGNPAWERILGHSREELLHLKISDFVHPDDLESTLKEVERGFAGIASPGFVNRNRCKNGSYKWIEWQAAPAPDHSLVFAAGRDVTERKRVREKLEEQDRQLSTIYSSVSDALFLLSVESADRYRFLTVNRTFLQLTGLKPSDVLGKYVHEVIPKASLPAV